MTALYSILAFIVAIGVLVTFHEFGHYIVARFAGVKILKFYVGFGKPLLRFYAGKDKTEYALAAIPLGGYVKMLDENEGDVSSVERDRAFNRQSLPKRMAIIFAGPLFNFILAVILYTLMFSVGVEGVKPVIGQVSEKTPASFAQFSAGDEIVSIDGTQTHTWEEANIALIKSGINQGLTEVEIYREDTGVIKKSLNFEGINILENEDALRKIGISPWRYIPKSKIGKVSTNSPAEKYNLQKGDEVLLINNIPVNSWNELVDQIHALPGQEILITVKRTGQVFELPVVTEKIFKDDKEIGRLGVAPYINAEEIEKMRVTIQYPVFQSIDHAIGKTYKISVLTAKVIGKLFTGDASIRNISGPVAIAEYAGVTATIGLAAFLSLLGLLSISLAIINLLPIPVLDGGHLFFCIVEWVKGSPVSESVQAMSTRAGMALIGAIMVVAVFNDINRFLGY